MPGVRNGLWSHAVQRFPETRSLFLLSGSNLPLPSPPLLWLLALYFLLLCSRHFSIISVFCKIVPLSQTTWCVLSTLWKRQNSFPWVFPSYFNQFRIVGKKVTSTATCLWCCLPPQTSSHLSLYLRILVLWKWKFTGGSQDPTFISA